VRKTGLSGALPALALVLLGQSGTAKEPPIDPETEEIVVLGIRPGTLDRDVSAFRDVLLTDDFAGEDQDLADLLTRQAGVFVRRFGGPGDASEVSIRGSSSAQVVVKVNGVRVNSALTGSVNVGRLCIPLIEEVGITRGGGGARGGSGAIGGVVDLVTRSAGPEPEVRATFSAGAFETFEGSLFGSGQLHELGVSVGYCGLDTEGDFQFARPEFRGPDGIPTQFTPRQAKRINNRSTQHGGSLSLGHSAGPGRLELFDFFQVGKGGAPGLDCCQDALLAGQNPKAEEADWSNLAQLRWKGRPTHALGGELEAMLYHRHEEARFRDPTQLFGGRVESLTRLSTVGLQIENAWDAAWFGFTQQFDLILDASQDLLYGTRQPSRERTRLAGAFSGELGFFDRRVRTTLALRADWADDFSLQWVPSLGVVLTPVDWFRIRANAGRAYRFPNFDELYLPNQGFQRGNPRLSPEDAWEFDVGAELLFAQWGPISGFQLSARYFRRVSQEQIVWLNISSTTVAPINTGDATTEGVELALDFNLTRFIQLGASHTEIDSTRDFTNKQLPGVPDRETSVRLRIGPQNQWKLVGELLYTGDILVDEGGGRVLPARTVWNASAALNLAVLPSVGATLASLWVYAALDNIADEAVRDSLAFPRPGRQGRAGFEVQW